MSEFLDQTETNTKDLIYEFSDSQIDRKLVILKMVTNLEEMCSENQKVLDLWLKKHGYQYHTIPTKYINLFVS
jgi:hypothetical protein